MSPVDIALHSDWSDNQAPRMGPRGNGDVRAAPQGLGNSGDVLEAVRQIHVGEDPPIAFGGGEPDAHRMSFASVRRVADNANVVARGGPEFHQALGRSVRATIAHEEHFPRGRTLAKKARYFVPRAFNSRTGIVSREN